MTAKLEMTWYLHDTYRGSALMYTDHEDIVAMEKFKGPYVIAQVSNSYVWNVTLLLSSYFQCLGISQGFSECSDSYFCTCSNIKKPRNYF